MEKKNPGPIILVEDDHEDQELFEEALNEIGVNNKVICFQTCEACWDYLKTTTDVPFLIFCDVNLPMKNGIEFKLDIDADPELRMKSIPFIFYSTSTNRILVKQAYTKMTIQGYFQKRSNFQEIKRDLKTITDYWSHSRHPNNF
jgi:CheY-like chemotaxis protein